MRFRLWAFSVERRLDSGLAPKTLGKMLVFRVPYKAIRENFEYPRGLPRTCVRIPVASSRFRASLLMGSTGLNFGAYLEVHGT